MKRLMTDINLIVCFLVFAIIILVLFFRMDDGNIERPVIDITNGWVYEDGSSVDLNDLRESDNYMSIHRTVTREESASGSLCFISRDCFFYIYLDGQIIYDFHPFMTPLYGKYYGNYIHTVNIPGVEENSDLEIVFDVLRYDHQPLFENMQITDSSSYIGKILSGNFGSFQVSFLVFTAGIFLVLLGFAVDIRSERLAETVSLGTLIILLSLWTNTGTYVFEAVYGNSAIPRVLEVVSLMLLPIPAMIFCAVYTGHMNSILVKIELLLSMVNIAAVFFKVLTGRKDYSDMLIFTHLVILTGMAMCAYMVFKGMNANKTKDRRYIFLLVSFGILVLTGSADMMRYYTGNEGDVARVTRIGLVFFTVILTLYEIQNYMEMSRKGMEAELKDRLAHIDSLTGLPNRLAFNESESEIKTSGKGKYIFVQFDINYLKQVNDNFGHKEGDIRIKAAADVIKGSFGKFGECFRIGGDEFFSILGGDDPVKDMDEAIKLFKELIERYNGEYKHEVPLVIAYGHAEYNAGTDDPEMVEQTADQRMYDNKRHLKETL